jgi:MFS family permease
MLTTVAPLSSLFAGVAILLTGMGLMGTVLAVRAGVEHFSDGVTGIVMAAYFVGFSVGAFICPPIIRRVGHIRAFAAMASIASTTAILHAMVVDPFVWGLLRLITGACLLGLYMVIESWLNTLSPTETRGRIFAFYMMVTLMALGLGQFLILLGDVTSFVTFGVVSVLLSLSLVPIAMTRVREPAPVESPSLSLRLLSRRSPLGVAGALTAGVTTGAFWGLGPLFAHRAGLSEAGIAAFMSAIIFGGALLQWPIGHLSDNRDRRKVLIGVCLGSALLAVAMLGALGISMWLLFLAAFAYGGFAFTVYGLSVAHVNDQVDPTEILEATKGLLLLHGIGASIGPIAGGFLMGALGHEVVLIYVAAIFVLAAIYGLHRMRVREAPPVEEQADYVPMSRTSSAVLEMDPRVEEAEAGLGDEKGTVSPAAS